MFGNGYPKVGAEHTLSVGAEHTLSEIRSMSWASIPVSFRMLVLYTCIACLICEVMPYMPPRNALPDALIFFVGLGHRVIHVVRGGREQSYGCLLYTSPSPRD